MSGDATPGRASRILLCELALRLRASGVSDGEIFDFPLTQEHIADATGLTAVHTNRTLQVLRKAELISLSSSRLVILDWEGLADVGDFNERYLHHTRESGKSGRAPFARHFAIDVARLLIEFAGHGSKDRAGPRASSWLSASSRQCSAWRRSSREVGPQETKLTLC